MMKNELLRKIENKEIVVGVVGLGYVGLPLAVEKAKAGFKTIGFDVQPQKVDMVNAGHNYIGDVVDSDLAEIVKSGMLSATTDFSFVKDVDFIAICVPTPLDSHQQPDISYVRDSATAVSKYLKKGTMVVLESTTYPGTTEEPIKPILENGSGLKCGEDFYLGFSPERVDPGNLIYKTKNTPKVVGAIGKDATEVIAAMYRAVLEGEVYEVSCPAVAEMEKILENNRLDEIALTLALREYYKLKRIVAICEKSGVHTKFVPDYNDIIPTRPYTEDLLGLPVVNIRHVPLTNSFNMICKRAMDIVGAIVAIIIFSPVMLVTAVLVKTTSKGPLIYKQERVGLHNQTFQMYKFRSMEVQSAKSEKRAWTVRDDPRVTKVGKVIRKTSIDELPQLFNILKGDMSLVGPRPERPFFVEKFREEIPRYMVKHQVRPGLTGWAQVNGYRGDTSIKKRIEYDLYYIENWTMGLDIKILFLTFFKGFVNKNAY